MIPPVHGSSGLSANWLRHAASRPVSLLLGASLGLGFFAPREHDDQRLLQIGLLLVCALLVVARGTGGNLVRLLAPLPARSLMVFFGLGVCSAILAFSPLRGLLEVATLFLLLLLSFALAQELRASFDRAFPCVLWIVAAVSTLYLLKILVIIAAALILGIAPDNNSFAPGFTNIRFLNHVQTILLPMLVLGAFSLDRRRLFFALAACMWALVFLLQARATMLAIGGGGVVCLLLGSGAARRYCLALALSAAAGALVHVAVFRLLPQWCGMEPFELSSEIMARTMNNPYSNRLDLWAAARDMILANPWLGVGPMHYAHAVPAEIGFAGPHNFGLQLGAEWGVPALLSAVTAIVCGLMGLLRARAGLAADDARNQVILAAWITTGVAISVDAMFSNSLVMPMSQISIALYLGCALGWCGVREPSPAANAPPRLAGLLSPVIVTSMVILCWGAVVAAQPSGARAELLHPRYWIQGHF